MQRKRQIEAQVYELQEKMLAQAYSEEEIERATSKLRKDLEHKSGAIIKSRCARPVVRHGWLGEKALICVSVVCIHAVMETLTCWRPGRRKR
jgi:hypothetical protein